MVRVFILVLLKFFACVCLLRRSLEFYFWILNWVHKVLLLRERHSPRCYYPKMAFFSPRAVICSYHFMVRFPAFIALHHIFRSDFFLSTNMFLKQRHLLSLSLLVVFFNTAICCQMIMDMFVEFYGTLKFKFSLLSALNYLKLVGSLNVISTEPNEF